MEARTSARTGSRRAASSSGMVTRTATSQPSSAGDIVHEWTLSPAEDGCDVAVRVTIPEEEAARFDPVRAEVLASMTRLVQVAQAAA